MWGEWVLNPSPPLPLHNMSCDIERSKLYYVNITVTNINKTRLVNMVIFRDFNFRDYVIKTNITIKFSRITDFNDSCQEWSFYVIKLLHMYSVFIHQRNLIALNLMLYARLHSKFCFQKIQRWIKCINFSVMNNDQITFKLRNFNA